MSPHRLLVPVLVLAAAAVVAAIVLVPRINRPQVLSGYVEGEPLYMAAPVAGPVRAVFVQRGERVAAGQELFVVDTSQVGGARDEALARLAAAEAQARDARKGQRPIELAVLDADIAAAEAQVRDAAAVLNRVRPLVKTGVYAPARLDDAKAAHDAALAQAAAARRRRDAAALGAREDQIRAAEAQVVQAKAAVASTSARLSDAAPSAPGPARVEDVFFQPGEWASANQPVLSLLPDARVKLRFFVPEASVALYRPGRTVRFSCDGCAEGLSAQITYVSPRPEFTPPVIYSRETRDRLVYLVEARPSALLNPGQPVDVVPLEARP
ncbi:MAG: HlyD family secretion protein [Phenylobacterium sp.]|uniref:HlyD family secretion protein n=1 Tax=Phenylobacterium sp. TaxID=1871053 RepID=UPI00391D8DA9